MGIPLFTVVICLFAILFHGRIGVVWFMALLGVGTIELFSSLPFLYASVPFVFAGMLGRWFLSRSDNTQSMTVLIVVSITFMVFILGTMILFGIVLDAWGNELLLRSVIFGGRVLLAGATITGILYLLRYGKQMIQHAFVEEKVTYW